MKLSVIIVNYNDKELTLNLLASLFKSTRLKDMEIIIVDNASRDGSVEALSSAHPQARIIANTQNRGFPPAVNQGIKASQGECIILLNPDLTITSGAIDTILKFMEGHPRAGAAGCKIVNPDGSVQLSGKRFPDPLVMLFVTFNLHKLFPNNPVTKKYYDSFADYDRTHQVEHLMASCLMVRRSAIDKDCLMDENFFLYCDDVDWCYRIHQAGFEIWYLAEAMVIHAKGGTTRRESYRGIIEYHRSAWYFYNKYYYQKYPKLLSLLFYCGLQVRKWWFLASNFFSREKKVKY